MKNALAKRLLSLERLTSTRKGTELRVYWNDELTPCSVHRDCLMEVATGEHRANVIRLAW